MSTLRATPGRLDIECEKGAGLHPSAFTWSASGSLVNLTNASAEFEIAVDGVSVYLASTATGEITLGGALGTIELDIPAEDIDAFEFTQAPYELRITLGDGSVYKLLKGTMIVSQGLIYQEGE
jgi:hypothetical protein